jgi:hypothetical protein
VEGSCEHGNESPVILTDGTFSTASREGLSPLRLVGFKQSSLEKISFFFFHMYLCQKQKYSSNLRTEESTCKKLTLVLGCFPAVRKHLFCVLCVCSLAVDHRQPQQMAGQIQATHSCSLMTCKRLLWYWRRRFSPVFLIICYWLRCLCSLQSSFRPKSIARHFTFLDQGIERLNNLSLGRRLMWA